jgi:F-type H+-transporting ATPase subunit a
MNLSDIINKKMQIETVFTLKLGGLEVPITETVIITWVVMAIIILGSLWWRSRLEKVPRGKQIFLEWVV